MEGLPLTLRVSVGGWQLSMVGGNNYDLIPYCKNISYNVLGAVWKIMRRKSRSAIALLGLMMHLSRFNSHKGTWGKASDCTRDQASWYRKDKSSGNSTRGWHSDRHVLTGNNRNEVQDWDCSWVGWKGWQFPGESRNQRTHPLRKVDTRAWPGGRGTSAEIQSTGMS